MGFKVEKNVPPMDSETIWMSIGCAEDHTSDYNDKFNEHVYKTRNITWLGIMHVSNEDEINIEQEQNEGVYFII